MKRLTVNHAQLSRAPNHTRSWKVRDVNKVLRPHQLCERSVYSSYVYSTTYWQ